MSMNDLIDQLEQLVGSDRVKSMFAELRAAVPRPKTLVFGFYYSCETTYGTYRYWRSTVVNKWFWTVSCRSVAFAGGEVTSEAEAIDAMQQHFNAAWSAMTTRRGLR